MELEPSVHVVQSDQKLIWPKVGPSKLGPTLKLVPPLHVQYSKINGQSAIVSKRRIKDFSLTLEVGKKF